MGKGIMIKIADFSEYPSGRDENDGEFNGTRFRQEVLLPAVNKALEYNDKVIVVLEGVLSFGSSFLDEAFAGLIRKEGKSKADVLRVLNIVAGKEAYGRYADAIMRYINRA